MGCDIHCYAEVFSTKDNESKNKWTYEEELDIDRYYRLFAILADVRNINQLEPIAKPKGFPEDASDTVKRKRQEQMIYFCHSSSYLTLREIVDYKQNSTSSNLRCLNEIIDKLTEIAQDNEEYYENVRIVFWFDN